MIIKFFFSLEPACKRSCQPIGNTALTDMQTTKSTAEQPRSPTVHIQQLEAEHSASLECLQYLARQAMPMQGDTDEESNFIQLLKLRGKDQTVLLNG